MIILYMKEDDRYLQAIPGFPKYEELGNKLYIESQGVMVVAANDLDRVGYEFYPDQIVNVPMIWDEGLQDWVEAICTVEDLDLREMEATDLPCSQHLSLIKEIDVQAARPVTVVRKAFGKLFDISCVITEDIKTQYLAGKIDVGDIVIVTYCEERAEDAIVTSKVFKSW